jgi:hypothetical protein
LKAKRESKTNKQWHAANRMPARATLDQRITWHFAHAASCGCRAMPPSIVAELKRRTHEPKRRTQR